MNNTEPSAAVNEVIDPLDIKPADVANVFSKFELDKLSKKSLQFLMFVPFVIDHLEKYVVPQYEDLPDEMIDGFDISDLKSQLMRYAGRSGKNARGPIEDHRDMVKLAHYSCYQLYKLQKRDGGDILTPSYNKE